MSVGHHFFGRAFSAKPQTWHTRSTHTSLWPVRLARDWTSHGGGLSWISTSWAAVSSAGRPCRVAIFKEMSKRWAASRRVIIALKHSQWHRRDLTRGEVGSRRSRDSTRQVPAGRLLVWPAA